MQNEATDLALVQACKQGMVSVEDIKKMESCPPYEVEEIKTQKEDGELVKQYEGIFSSFKCLNRCNTLKPN